MGQSKILSSYYALLADGEGMQSSEIENLASAHPLRVVPLYRYLRSLDDGAVEVVGERFIGDEIDILMLTTGKLSAAEIASRLRLTVERVIKVLLRLERRHFIVFCLH